MRRLINLFALFLLSAYSGWAALTYDGIIYYKINVGGFDYAAVQRAENKNITTANIREMAYGTYVVQIGNSAFEECSSLKEVTLPSKLTTVSGKAFSGCNRLRSIALPDKVGNIGISAFAGCFDLSVINLPLSKANRRLCLQYLQSP